MIILIIYLAVLFAIGIHDYYSIKGFDDYVLAGRKQKQGIVTMSILATVVGASATMGISTLAARYGITAFLWLGSGGIALMLQSVFLSERIRNLNVYTLPGLAELTAGREGKILTSLIIVISWTGIIAAQFVALSSIASLLTGMKAGAVFMIICSAVIIIYTAFGGQFSIMRTDALQFILLAAGITAALFAVMGGSSIGLTDIISFKGSGSGDTVPVVKIFHLIFIVGGAYFIGPDIFSRNFTSDSASTARKATMTAGAALLLISIAVTLIGVYAALLDPGLSENPFIFIIKNIAGKYVGIIIILGLLSAVISSTDTCIMTVAAIIEKEIIGRTNIITTRVIVLVTGTASLLLALFRKDILSLLTGTYSVFSPGVVFPLFTSLVVYGKRRVSKPLWLAAVCAGGLFGIAGNITGREYLSLAGMGVSAGLSLLSVLKQAEKPQEFK
ncbi:MAG: sodium:solute symporter family protein [Spirochaetia bacterium]|nr:sodium:solute symporter family protein [Spirochaetia bacterium]